MVSLIISAWKRVVTADEGGGDAREGNGCFFFVAMLGSVGGRIKFHHLGTGAVEKKEDDELDMH